MREREAPATAGKMPALPGPSHKTEIGPTSAKEVTKNQSTSIMGCEISSDKGGETGEATLGNGKTAKRQRGSRAVEAGLLDAI